MSQVYPKNIVWYCEARPWSGSVALPGFAPADPTSLGSGVVVELEQLDEENRAFPSPKLRKYLLTCGHVVREVASNGQIGWGPLLEELLCWQPGKGYIRTYPNQRKSGDFRGVWRATVSKLSPCEATRGEIPEEKRLAYNDWVLLDFEDEEFQAMPALQNWGTVVGEIALKIVGFPGGAGLLADKNRGHFWEMGDLVESADPGSFQQKRTPDAGMLKLDGPDETRPGMSGGGIFDSNNAFVGLHRSAAEAAMARGAISSDLIRTWLAPRHFRPAASALMPATIALPKGPKPVDPTVIQALALGDSPKIPFINRSKLRGNLESLTKINNRYKILSLTGQKGTGKSWTWHLIQHVANQHQVTPVILDISQAQEVDEVCETIVDQMGLDVDDMRAKVLIDSPAKERIGRKFTAWLARMTAALKPAKWWLVVDGLDEADRPSHELYEHLVQWFIKGLREDRNFTQVILMILGADVATDALLSPYVLDERLEGMMRADVESFLTKYALGIGRSLKRKELAAIMQTIAGDLTGPFNAQQMDSIRKETSRVIESVLR